MKYIWNCRRTFIGLTAIICLTALGFYNIIDVSIAITGVVASIAGSNAYQKSQEKKYDISQYDIEDK